MANKRKTTQLDQQIDENLRRVYADAAQEPVPDRFAKLLEQLRARGDEEQPKPSEDQL
ncbi:MULTISPECIES: NepR family anti-sigma factor [unclassified Yoonia]|uniref:NepR family anti-sigma factor n=1 Tax=unclassified Yoonia TaxID=2629118 RepID=UPI002AFE4297|nr:MULTISPECIES: NepR family anti-sigma factor [unclassified Yoonia]